jgi:hypothetical protein
MFEHIVKYYPPKNVLNKSSMNLQHVSAVLYNLLTYFTPYCKILFEKLIVTQLIKTYPAFFMEPKGSSPYSQKPATGPYTELVSSTDPYLPKVQLNVILQPMSGSSQWSLTFGPLNQKPCKHLSPPPCMPHVPPTSSSLI